MPTEIPSEILDRLPPCDIEAEKKIIGSVLHLPAILDHLKVRPGDFHQDRARRIYAAFLAMQDRGWPIEPHALLKQLEATGELEAAGGAIYLEECIRCVGAPSNAPHYAITVAKKACLRKIIQTCQDAMRECWDTGVSPEDVLASVERRLQAIATGAYSTEPVSMREAVMEAMIEIDEMLSRRNRAGLMVGIPEFDQSVGGFFPGELSVIAARPGQGKSALSMQFAFHQATMGHRTYFATLEMSKTDLAIRNLCAISGVSNQRIRTASIGDADVRSLSNAVPACSLDNLMVHDWPAIRVYDIRRAVRKLKPEIVYIDYLQLVTPADRQSKRYEQIGQITKELKAMAREENIPVVVCAQLNRQADNQGRELPPKLSHLKESGNIEEDADMVMLLYRPRDGVEGRGRHEGQKWDASLEVAKNRKGATLTLRMMFDKDRTLFSAYATPIHDEFSPYANPE